MDIINQWVDCGSYQDFHTEYGIIGLAGRPSYCNRGNYVLSLMTDPPVNILLNLISGNYYFLEKFAKQEIETWVDLCRKAVADGSINRLDKSATLSTKELLFLHVGKNCKVKIYSFKISPLDNKFFVASLEINKGDELELFVDWADAWDRKIYLSLEIARSEIMAWLLRRNQI